jgi:membrane peptidoglycan carboxypeptidase
VVQKRAVSSEVAADVTYALSSVVDSGTGRAASALKHPVAGKTGTKDREDDIVSAWFVGMTTQISTAVMYVAGDSGTDDLDPYARPGDSTFFGGTYPALTWADYMEVATEDQPVEDFPEPAYVNRDIAPAPTFESDPTDEPSPTAEPTPTDEPTGTPTATQTTTEPADDQASTAPATTKPPKRKTPTTAPPTTQPPNATARPTARPSGTRTRPGGGPTPGSEE